MKRWLITLIFFASPGLLLAAPTINTAVASNTANGTQITVQGSNFGTKPNGVKANSVWVEGQPTRNPHSLYSRNTSWSSIAGEIASISSGVDHSGNNNRQLGLDFRFCSIASNFNYYLEVAVAAGSTIWSQVDRYRTFPDTDPMNNKTWRGWSSGYSIPDFVQSYCKDPGGGPSGCGDQSNRCFTETAGSIWDESYQGDFPAVDEWEVNTYEWRKGVDESVDDGVADGYWKNVRNGVVNQFGDDLVNGPAEIELWWIVQEFTGSGTCPGAGEYEYMKNIYFDDSLSAIFISSRNSNGTCTAITDGTFIRPAFPFGWAASSASAYNNNWNVDVTYGMCVTLRDSAGDLSNTIAVTGGGTQLGTVLSGVTSSSFTATWTTAGGSQYAVAMSSFSNFSVPLSSGVLAGVTTGYTGLNPSTTYFFEVKVSTEGSYNSAVSTATLPLAGGGGGTPSTIKLEFNNKRGGSRSMTGSGRVR